MRTFGLGGEHRQQVEALEDEADLVAAQHGQLIVVHGGDVGAVEHGVTASLAESSPASVCMSVDLPEPDGPMIAVEPPLLEPHIDAAQRVHRVFAMPVVLDQVDRLDGDGVPLFLRRTGIGLRLHDLLFHNVLFHINTGIFPGRPLSPYGWRARTGIVRRGRVAIVPIVLEYYAPRHIVRGFTALGGLARPGTHGPWWR